MNFCPFCGKRIDDSVTFCGFCGKPVEGSSGAFAPAPQTAPQPQYRQQQQPQQPPKRKPIGLIIGISAGAAVLLIGAVLAVVLLIVNKKADDSSYRVETSASKKEDVESKNPMTTSVSTTSVSETTVDSAVITDKQAEAAIENYILKNYPDVKTSSATCYWGLDSTKSTNDTAVVFFRSYTGAHMTYYINRATGETYETSYLPNIDPDKPEEKTGVSFNVKDYMNGSESTPATDTATETSSTPTPTPRPQILRKVKVTDAYKKSYKNEFGYKVTDRVPKITIEGVNTNAINNAIYSKCKSRFKYGGMSYSYYIGKNYISIIINMEPCMSDPRIEVFNVSRSSGKQLSRSQMLKLLGLTSKKFEARTKKSIAKTLKRIGTYKSLYKKATTKKMLKSAIPCVNSKGKVCFYMRQMPDGCASDSNDHVEPI